MFAEGILKMIFLGVVNGAYFDDAGAGQADGLGDGGAKIDQVAALDYHFVGHAGSLRQLRDFSAVGTGHAGGDAEGDAGGCAGGDAAPFGARGFGNYRSSTFLQLVEVKEVGQGGCGLCGDWGQDRCSGEVGHFTAGVNDPGQLVFFV